MPTAVLTYYVNCDGQKLLTQGHNLMMFVNLIMSVRFKLPGVPCKRCKINLNFDLQVFFIFCGPMAAPVRFITLILLIVLAGPFCNFLFAQDQPDSKTIDKARLENLLVPNRVQRLLFIPPKISSSVQ